MGSVSKGSQRSKSFLVLIYKNRIMTENIIYMNMKKIAIFGAGGLGLEVATLIKHINVIHDEWEIIGFFDDAIAEGKVINNYPVLGGIETLNLWDSQLFLVLALGNPGVKKHVYENIINNKVSYPVLIHPSAIIGSREFISIGKGSIICAGNILTTNIKIGKQVILNLSCTVGHECEVGDFSSIMPACNISGEVKIGEENFWGTGAKVINRKRIGNKVIVGAGAVIIDDIPDAVTVVGVPAKIIKKNV
jgi:sugar O-acyltransferase (sialic acid O-acetyltransferase NeuD family)